MPPAIESSSNTQPFCDPEILEQDTNPFCFGAETQKAYVSASDPDDDVLEFTWEGSVSGLIGNATTTPSGDLQFSEVLLVSNQLVDGEELRCRVSDGSADVFQTWTVRVF